MRELPMQFDRRRDTWVQTPSGSIRVTPQAGYRYYVRPKNQRAEFVPGIGAVDYVREVAARMGGVLGWNLGESKVSEGQAKEFLKQARPSVEDMRFSRDEVEIGVPVLYRNEEGWDERTNAHFRITGSDHFRVSGFFRLTRWGDPHRTEKDTSTHVGLKGVYGPLVPWERFLATAVKPHLFNPRNKYQGNAFSVPPDQRESLSEGTAKDFFRKITPTEIKWTGAVRVTRDASGRGYRWTWSAVSPPLVLVLDDEGAGVYSASFYKPGDSQMRILVDQYRKVAWEAQGITHAENIAKDLLAHALLHPNESRAQVLVACLLESPQFSTLKKHKVKLTPEEREQAVKAGAVWHHGPGGEASCAIWKSVVNGKTWYGCNTHRAGQVKSTLKGAIRAFEFVKTTA